MVYDVVAVLVAVLAALIFVLSLKLLLAKGWLLMWLKGSLGMAVALAATVLALAAWDLHSYKTPSPEGTIAHLSFKKLEPQSYSVNIKSANGYEDNFVVDGDMWQLDSRVLRWHQSLSKLGLGAGFRLAMISGRYYSYEDDQSKRRIQHDIKHSAAPVEFDIWHFVHNNPGLFPWIRASLANASYVPMADSALYAVELHANGISVKALNSTAKAQNFH